MDYLRGIAQYFIVIVAFTLANLFLNCNCESSFIIASDYVNIKN